jgi:hypothetical protein
MFLPSGAMQRYPTRVLAEQLQKVFPEKDLWTPPPTRRCPVLGKLIQVSDSASQRYKKFWIQVIELMRCLSVITLFHTTDILPVIPSRKTKNHRVQSAEDLLVPICGLKRELVAEEYAPWDLAELKRDFPFMMTQLATGKGANDDATIMQQIRTEERYIDSAVEVEDASSSPYQLCQNSFSSNQEETIVTTRAEEEMETLILQFVADLKYTEVQKCLGKMINSKTKTAKVRYILSFSFLKQSP